MSAQMNTVVIGIGNEFRRDDGFGPAVLARLRDLAPADVLLVHSEGDPVGLIEAWAGARTAVLIDVVPGDSPGRAHRLVIDGGKVERARPVSSHGFGVGEAIELARVLGRLPDRVIVHAVQASDFGYGTGLTQAVSAATEPVAAAVLADLAS